jgi:hypothetical protein
VAIIGVEKNIKIQADALLPAGSYLYYNLNGHRHYKNISEDPINAEEEICFDIDVVMLNGFEDSGILDGSDIHFKILESNGESNGKTWYDPNKEYNEEYQIAASGGETVVGLVTNNVGAFGSDMGVKFHENYTKYRIYFTKYDSFGRYWITQVNHVDLEATNIQSINVFSQEQTYFEHSENSIKKDDLPVYLWENIDIEIDFKPNAEVSFEITEGYS